ICRRVDHAALGLESGISSSLSVSRKPYSLGIAVPGRQGMGAVPLPMHQQTTVGFTAATQRRQAVLLCTELRGLARMSEALEPPLVILLANEFFAFASDIVTGHGGEAVTSQHEMLLSTFTQGNAIQASQQAVRAAQRV